YVLQNEDLIIAGTVVGAAGTLLTRLMAKAMNRPISNVLFSNFGGGGAGQEITGSQKPVDAADAASLLYLAEKVIIVPGYGMAVAQAQHKIWELTQQLIKRDKDVKFAIHPVAGRMPGHMNVLLAEAGVPYDLIADMEDINPEFPTCDVAIVIGANDVVNPVAKTDPSSPIYGMPILDVSLAKQTIVIKRGKGTGFAGIENALFYADNTRMLFADGQEAASRLIAELKGIDAGGGHGGRGGPRRSAAQPPGQQQPGGKPDPVPRTQAGLQQCQHQAAAHARRGIEGLEAHRVAKPGRGGQEADQYRGGAGAGDAEHGARSAVAQPGQAQHDGRVHRHQQRGPAVQHPRLQVEDRPQRRHPEDAGHRGGSGQEQGSGGGRCRGCAFRWHGSGDPGKPLE